ncbi:TPA: hypothetical protein HA265_03875 [Candidatus Woesearchaeota archaeon]|nr:hypothetical protein [Candidatus Woesearchaeota archaeon]
MPKNERAPKLIPNGLRYWQYTLLNRIDDSIDRYGVGLFVEVVNGLVREDQLARKVAHAVDAKRFFRERKHEGVKAMVTCVKYRTSVSLDCPSLDAHLMVPEYSPEILRYMLYCGPRLVPYLRKDSPYNSDFFDRHAGIIPKQQQLIYHVIREALRADVSPDDIFQGSRDIFAKGGISLPDVDDRLSLNTMLSNCRGPFLEMYAASCWMYALQDYDYDFFSRVSFPMWGSAHLNGHPLKSGLRVEPGRRKQVAEIDVVFALPEKAYHEGLEKVLRL